MQNTAAMGATPEQIPLVGPGSELQLTLDGRAVPHLEVVRARSACAQARHATDADDRPPDAPPPADGQTAL